MFLPGGKVPELGATFNNPDIAKALGLIAEKGRDAFYKGEIAQAIVQTSAAMGGTMELQDLADFSAEWVEPISTTLSWLENLRTSAECPGHGRSGNAQYHGNFSAR